MSANTNGRASKPNNPPGSGRDANGRFAPGNPGGPGNPYARKVAQLRKALVNFITDEDMKEIALVLKEKAKRGNTAAIKLLFQYALGKPLTPTDPDRLDVDEWQKVQEQARPATEVHEVMQRLPAETVCNLTRFAWPCAVEQNLRAPLRASLQAMDARDAERAQANGKKIEKPANEKDAASEPATPKANGVFGAGPDDAWLERMVAEAMASSRAANGGAGPNGRAS